MRYQKEFVQNRVRVLGDTLSKISLSVYKQSLGRHGVTNKKDGAQRVLKGKRIVY